MTFKLLILRKGLQLIKPQHKIVSSLISVICWVIKKKRKSTQLHTMVRWVRMFGIAVWRMAVLAAVIVPSLNLPISVYLP